MERCSITLNLCRNRTCNNYVGAHQEARAGQQGERAAENFGLVSMSLTLDYNSLISMTTDHLTISEKLIFLFPRLFLEHYDKLIPQI